MTQSVRVLTRYDLLENPTLDNFLYRINQRPLKERLKLLNSNSLTTPYPRFLYKYRPLVKNSAGQTAAEQVSQLRDYLVESRLWLSSPSSFNDPFDMRGRHIFKGTPQDKRKLFINKLEQFRPDLNKKQREFMASDLLARGDFGDRMDSILEAQRQEIGVCSFAGNPKNILMWSHYGSNHTGVCLQFHLAQDVIIFSRSIHVEYSNEYPLIDYHEYQKGLATTLFRKAEGWRYEQERRIIHPHGESCYLAFNPAALTALILGCEISPSSEKAIKELIIERQQKGLPPIRVFRARRHNTQYRLSLFSASDINAH